MTGVIPPVTQEVNMDTVYLEEKDLPVEQLETLFSALDWSSGKYPDRLRRALTRYGCVISAWQGERLVGLAAAMDDGEMTAYVHYLLVLPEKQGAGIGRELMRRLMAHYAGYLKIVLCSYRASREFYLKCGFKADDESTVMTFGKLKD